MDIEDGELSMSPIPTEKPVSINFLPYSGYNEKLKYLSYESLGFKLSVKKIILTNRLGEKFEQTIQTLPNSCKSSMCQLDMIQ